MAANGSNGRSSPALPGAEQSSGLKVSWLSKRLGRGVLNELLVIQEWEL